MMRDWFVAILALAGLCICNDGKAKRLEAAQIYAFGQVESGRWVAIPFTDVPRYLNTTRIECSATKAEIDITWRTQSGDWVIFDAYRTTAPFFSRTIKFAQSNQTIAVTKPTPSAEPSVRYGGQDTEQYDFLLEEFPIKLRVQDFPFALPHCAHGMFGAQ